MEKENNLVKYHNDSIVKYHNDLNSVNFKGFKEKELDIFFSICLRMKEQGTNIITFSFSELKELSDYRHRSLAKFMNDLDNIYKKLINLNLKYEDEEKLLRFVLFSEYEIDKKEKIMKIKANEKFEYILNNFMGNYTKFDLIDFVNLKSTYSKNMFKTLKQYNTGWCDLTVEDFRNILDVPEKYRFSEIDKKVLKPISEELPKYFKGLKYEKIKKGKAIERIKFTWEQKKIFEKENFNDSDCFEGEIVEIKISENLNKAIEKAKKNRFILPLFTNENVEKLINQFEEEVLIKGLNKAYKEIQQEIKSINYLIKTIESSLDNKKIIVERKNVEELKIEENVENTKKEVTKEEFENLYIKFIKENGATDDPMTRKFFSMGYKIIDNENNENIEENNKEIEKIIKEIEALEKKLILRRKISETIPDKNSVKYLENELQIVETEIEIETLKIKMDSL